MTSPRYDSVLISIDWISFRYFFRRDFRAYLVVVSADTNGTIGIYESPETYSVLHRPLRDKPATIDFGFDGFVIYSSAGAVPDLVRFDVFVVKDRSKGRRVGALQELIQSSREFEATLDAARDAMASTTSDGSAAASVARAVSPVLELVGSLAKNLDGEVIEAYAGSKIFDGAMVRKDEDEERRRIHQAVISPTGNIQTKVDITLFQRQELPGGSEVREPRRDVPDRVAPDRVAPDEDPRPPEDTATEDDAAFTHDAVTDPTNIAISLRRPRRLFRLGWMTAGLVPVGIALTAIFSKSASAVGRGALVMALVATLMSPALLYGAGQWARARRGEKGLSGLGWVAVAFHGVSLVFVGLGVYVLVDTLRNLDAGFDGIAQLFAALIGTIMLVLVSYVPWVVSVILSMVFGRRATRT